MDCQAAWAGAPPQPAEAHVGRCLCSHCPPPPHAALSSLDTPDLSGTSNVVTVSLITESCTIHTLTSVIDSICLSHDYYFC